MDSNAPISPSREHLWNEIASDLRSNRLLPSLTSGLIVGMVEIILVISFAALIFTGDLQPFVARGVGLFLLGAIFVSVVVALFSSLSGLVAGTQDAPAAILAVMAVAITSALANTTTPEEKFFTVVAAIALSTMLTGLFFLTLGYLRLGGLVRFLPYPVIGGFLAGTGWLLATGALTMMSGFPVSLSQATMFIQPQVILTWLPGVLFGFAILIVQNRYRHPFILPALVLVATGLFYGIALAAGSSITELSAQGWLLGPFPQGNLWQPVSPALLVQVNWPVILGQITNTSAILVISTVALLLNASGLELVASQDVDLNQELRAAGFGNLLSGLAAGIVGYQQLGLSTMNIKLGTRSRLPGLFSSLLCFFALFFGASLISLFPKLVLGGLLFYLGLTFLFEWVVQTWGKLPIADYLVIILILIVTASMGIMQGIAVGTLVAVILFVINYSRADVVKHAMTADTYHSPMTRSRQERQILNELGKQVYILELQGYIFFGTANYLLEQIHGQIETISKGRLRYVVMDFCRVTGIDSSVTYNFSKLRQLALKYKIKMVLTGLTPHVNSYLSKAGIVEENIFQVLPDLNQGVEWCENQLLQTCGMEITGGFLTLEQQLLDVIGESEYIPRLLKYLEKIELPAGTKVIQQGDAADTLYFIEKGQLTAQIEHSGKNPIRLQTMNAENVIGEIGFYLNTSRSASVVTEAPSTIYCLTKENMHRMENEDPEAATLFHKLIVNLMADRIIHLTATIDNLTR